MTRRSQVTCPRSKPKPGSDRNKRGSQGPSPPSGLVPEDSLSSHQLALPLTPLAELCDSRFLETDEQRGRQELQHVA